MCNWALVSYFAFSFLSINAASAMNVQYICIDPMWDSSNEHFFKLALYKIFITIYHLYKYQYGRLE